MMISYLTWYHQRYYTPRQHTPHQHLDKHGELPPFVTGSTANSKHSSFVNVRLIAGRQHFTVVILRTESLRESLWERNDRGIVLAGPFLATLCGHMWPAPTNSMLTHSRRSAPRHRNSQPHGVDSGDFSHLFAELHSLDLKLSCSYGILV